MNVEMPPEPFMKMAAREVLSLRKKVAELEEENKALVEENDTLRSHRLSYEESIKMKATIDTLKGQIKSYKEDSTVRRLREGVRACKAHTVVIAKRYVEAMNENRPPRFKYLLELAYIAGRQDETFDFNAFYKDITEE